MKPHVRFAILLGTGIAGVTAVLGLFFATNPIGVSRWVASGALERMELEKMTVETDRGLQIYYRGGSSPRVLVLLHGLDQRAATWVNATPTLMTRYSLVILDLAGHGESAPQRGIFSAEDLMAGVSAVLDAAAPDVPVTLLGHGLGGRMALRYALNHPERVEHIVLINGGVDDAPTVDLVPRDRRGTEELFRAISPEGTSLPAGFVLDDLRQKLEQGAIPRFLDAADTAGPLAHLALDQLTTPVDILWGADDGLYPLDTARRLAAALPRARLRELHGCGHLPHQQCTGPFLEALFEQLSQEPPAGVGPIDNAGG
ncbi:MAG: alpha/beta hydrolase [Acidobacteriota bacterium]